MRAADGLRGQDFAASVYTSTPSSPLRAGEHRSHFSEQDYVSWLLEDEGICDGMGEVVPHVPCSTDAQRELSAARIAGFPEVPFGMIEWHETVGRRDAGMGSALVPARTAHSEPTIANVSSRQDRVAVCC